MAIHSKLPDILLNLAGASRSGVFRAQKGSVKKQLILKNGDIAFAESNLPEDHIARIMVSMGFLKQSDLNEIISLMKTGKNSEEAVSALECSEPDAVDKGLREQVVAVISSLLGWGDCDMHFYPGDNLIVNRRNLGLNIPEILVVSARRAVSKRLVRVPPGFLEGVLGPNEARTEASIEYPLDDAEKDAFLRTRDKISAVDLVPLISAADATPEEVLSRLYVLGLIQTEENRDAPAFDNSGPDSADPFEKMIEDMLLRFETADFYEILSVKPDAGPDEIRGSYHNLAKQYHPDRFQSSVHSDSLRNQVEKVFAYINKAYLTLREPASRAHYDEERLKGGGRVEAAIKARASKDIEEEKMVEALFVQGRKSLARGDYTQAVTELNTCVYMRPGKAIYNHYLGLAESEIPGLNKNAEQHFLKAIELERLSADSYIGLAKLYLKVRLVRKASGLLKELLRWDPDNPKAKSLLDRISKEAS